MYPARVTLPLLRALGACEDQIDIFEALYPDGVDVAPATVEAAHVAGLNVVWLATSEARATRDAASAPAKAAYQAATAPAKAAYRAAVAQAWADYQATIAPAWADYQAAIAPAKADYQAAVDKVWAAYQDATAPVWADYQAGDWDTLAVLIEDAVRWASAAEGGAP